MAVPQCGSGPFHAVAMTPDYMNGLLGRRTPPLVFNADGEKLKVRALITSRSRGVRAEERAQLLMRLDDRLHDAGKTKHGV